MAFLLESLHNVLCQFVNLRKGITQISFLALVFRDREGTGKRKRLLRFLSCFLPCKVTTLRYDRDGKEEREGRIRHSLQQIFQNHYRVENARVIMSSSATFKEPEALMLMKINGLFMLRECAYQSFSLEVCQQRNKEMIWRSRILCLYIFGGI